MSIEINDDDIYISEDEEEKEILDIDEDEEDNDEEDFPEEDDEEDLPDEDLEDEILNNLDDILENYNDEEEKGEEIIQIKTTFNILTKYEKNYILGFRTQQISNGSVILIDVNKLVLKSAYEIAKEELRQKRIPFKIKRTLPNGKVEIWNLEDMIIY